MIRNNWRRCRIVEINKKVANVECLDDCCKIVVEVKKLEKLCYEFCSLPRIAFRCKLFGLDSEKLLKFNMKAIEKFNDMISSDNKELLAEIVDVKEEDNYQFFEINLFIDGKNITDWLSEMSKN